MILKKLTIPTYKTGLSTIEPVLLHFGQGSQIASEKYPIFPCFLPFAGCPTRCVFCAQNLQTGLDADFGSLQNILQKVEKNILNQKPKQLELAFYGGTFTRLSWADQSNCLDLGHKLNQQGFKVKMRCSTRPDSLNLTELHTLKEQGLNLIELGVQSFDSRALQLSGRAYSGAVARAGCELVQSAKLGLGIQLLPGMPGVTPEIFLADVKQALQLNPVCLRFYPCLVIKNTELARLWQVGEYQPWDIPTTLKTLGLALSWAWARQIPVIRLSLAPEPDLLAAMLAGPYHARLGNMIQRQAFIYTLQKAVASGQAVALELPKFCQGFAFGSEGAPWDLLNLPKTAVTWTEAKTGYLWIK